MSQVRREEDFYRDYKRLSSRVDALERLIAQQTVITNGQFPENPYDGQIVYVKDSDTQTNFYLYRYREFNSDGSQNTNATKWEPLADTVVGAVASSRAFPFFMED